VTAIYLDHNATTPLDPAVRDEMAACLDVALGNASSIHSLGQEARLNHFTYGRARSELRMLRPAAL
jgi:cysteine sulfinate desulfinase/cysteine desulfurase-like protein